MGLAPANKYFTPEGKKITKEQFDERVAVAKKEQRMTIKDYSSDNTVPGSGMYIPESATVSEETSTPTITPPSNTQDQSVTPETTTPSTPTITPQRAPTQNVGSVERETSYERPSEGTTSVVALPPPQQSSGGGGGGGSSTRIIGSGNLLNSYYTAQLLGSLYKLG